MSRFYSCLVYRCIFMSKHQSGDVSTWRTLSQKQQIGAYFFLKIEKKKFHQERAYHLPCTSFQLSSFFLNVAYSIVGSYTPCKLINDPGKIEFVLHSKNKLTEVNIIYYYYFLANGGFDHHHYGLASIFSSILFFRT